MTNSPSPAGLDPALHKAFSELLVIQMIAELSPGSLARVLQTIPTSRLRQALAGLKPMAAE